MEIPDDRLPDIFSRATADVTLRSLPKKPQENVRKGAIKGLPFSWSPVELL